MSRVRRVEVGSGSGDILTGGEQRRRHGEWAGWDGGLTNTHAGHGSVCATKGRENAVGVSEVRTWQRAPAAQPKSSRGGEILPILRCREAPFGAPGPLVRRPEQRRSSQPRPCRLSPGNPLRSPQPRSNGREFGRVRAGTARIRRIAMPRLGRPRPNLGQFLIWDKPESTAVEATGRTRGVSCAV